MLLEGGVCGPFNERNWEVYNQFFPPLSQNNNLSKLTHRPEHNSAVSMLYHGPSLSPIPSLGKCSLFRQTLNCQDSGFSNFFLNSYF